MGDFKNSGREWHPEGTPEEVRVHDFLIKNLGKAIPYGVYDMLHNQGWVSVGIDHDTAQICRPQYSELVVRNGPTAISPCHGVVDHSRRRR